jgi:hypothetical protein
MQNVNAKEREQRSSTEKLNNHRFLQICQCFSFKMNCRSRRIAHMTVMDELVSAICGAAVVLVCESEYSCLKLFKRKKTLFFFACQFSIWSTALETALNASMYFVIGLRVLPMLIVILIIQCVGYISYPIMILLRLRFVRYFPETIMYIPIVLAVIFTALKYSWIHWALTDQNYYTYFLIILPITTVVLAVQNMVINMFFIVTAIKRYENIVHVKSVIIVNIIVIILECIKIVIELVVVDKWVITPAIFVIGQLKVRLEIEILSYITQTVREHTISG